jgi:hypothetical protein
MIGSVIDEATSMPAASRRSSSRSPRFIDGFSRGKRERSLTGLTSARVSMSVLAMQRRGTTVQRYLLMAWLAGLLLTVFLAGLGVFEITKTSTLPSGSTKLVESNNLDPHRIAGYLLILVALVILVVGVVVRDSPRQTRMSIVFGVLAVVQAFLAMAGSDSGAFWGGLHVLNAFALTGIAIGLQLEDRRILNRVAEPPSAPAP